MRRAWLPSNCSGTGLTQQRRSFRYLLAKWSRRMAVMQAFVRIIPNSQTATRTCKRHDLRIRCGVLFLERTRPEGLVFVSRNSK